MHLSDILERLQGKSARLTFVSEKGEETVRSLDDLFRDTNALVAQLKQIGAAPGGRIGILAPNSYHWMVWDLAIMALDCVSVALPQEPPAEAVESIADRRGLQLLAVDPSLVPAGAMDNPWVLDYKAPAFAGKGVLHQGPISHAPGTHSLVFSSGTTGKTKGLIISAPGTENLLNLYGDAFGTPSDDRLLTFLPFANYQQRMAYYFCLYHGMEFVYVPFTRMFAGLKKYQPSYIIAPPIFYESLQNMAQAGAAPAAAPAAANDGADSGISARLAALLGGNIRYLITGMAPIKLQTLEFFWRHGVKLYEAFGITEAGMVAWNKPGRMKVGTVGQPAEAGSVTLSEEGEVIVTRKALLSLGYFEASEEDSRNTFVGPNSVATGDIAEFDEGGFLTIVGRKKDAIITKAGEKFHPEPIESQIQAIPGVTVAVVMGGDSLPGITAIVSTPHADKPETTAAMRERIAGINETLPASQQLKRVEFTTLEFNVENNFRTKNMKLNRKAIQSAFVQHGISLGVAAGGSK
ncbi:MAG TPA: AMP-binding protein [Paucimonas sp.]|nr:AMP-binding protein [Paucimonas sp.]